MEEKMKTNAERAKLVKKLREERGWPQSQLAVVADVNLRTIQRLEKDGSASLHTLQGIAQALEIDVKLLNSPTAALQKRTHLMPRLIQGNDFAEIFRGADQFQFEHDEADSEKSLSFMTSILNELKASLVRWHDGDLAERVRIESVLSDAIKQMEVHGFYLFGIKRIIPKISGEQMSLLTMGTIYMSHSRSLRIVRDHRFMVVPAALTEVAT